MIPAFNSERYIAATLEGVTKQTFEDWELVVWDDGSTDATADVARTWAARDPRIRVVGGANAGVAQARNRGLDAIADGSEFVALLDNDDVWEPDALACLVGFLDEHPELGAVHGLARCIDSDGRPTPDDDLEEAMRARTAYEGGELVPLPPGPPTTFAALVHHNWVVTTGTQLFRRAALDRAGRFDPACEPADDWDMVVRVSRLGPIGYVDRPVLWWRRHEATLSGRSAGWRRARYRVRRKMLADPTNTAEQRRAALSAGRDEARALWHDAWAAARRGRLAHSVKALAKASDGQVRAAGWAVSRAAAARGRRGLS